MKKDIIEDLILKSEMSLLERRSAIQAQIAVYSQIQDPEPWVEHRVAYLKCELENINNYIVRMYDVE